MNLRRIYRLNKQIRINGLFPLVLNRTNRAERSELIGACFEWQPSQGSVGSKMRKEGSYRPAERRRWARFQSFLLLWTHIFLLMIWKCKPLLFRMCAPGPARQPPRWLWVPLVRDGRQLLCRELSTLLSAFKQIICSVLSLCLKRIIDRVA